MENVPFMDGLLFTSEEWWFSIAMLNSHRVHGLLRMACAAKHVRHISSQCRAAVVIVISVRDCLPGHDVILRHQLQHFAEHSMDLFVCCFRPAIENNHSMTGAENAWLASWSAKDRLKDVPKSLWRSLWAEAPWPVCQDGFCRRHHRLQVYDVHRRSQFQIFFKGGPAGALQNVHAFSCTSEWQLSARNYQLPVTPTGWIAQMRWCWNYWLFCTDGQTKKTLQVLECPRSGIVFWETCGSLLLRDTTKQKMRKSCKGDGGESRATS